MNEGSRLATKAEMSQIVNRKRTMKTKQYSYENRTRCLIPEVKKPNALKDYAISTIKAVLHITRALCLTMVGLLLMAFVYWTGLVLLNGQWDAFLASGIISALLGIICFLLYDEKNH